MVYVTPYERTLLAKAGVQSRRGWVGSDKLETHILHQEGGPKIAVLVLPPLETTARSVPQLYIHQVQNAVLGLRGSVKLIVALSSWGYMHEQELINGKGALPDILLGSGPGIGQVGSIVAEGQTLWVRGYAQGKSVLRVQVLAWPDHNSTFKWTEEKNVRMTLFGLTDDFQENPQMLTLMNAMGTD